MRLNERMDARESYTSTLQPVVALIHSLNTEKYWRVSVCVCVCLYTPQLTIYNYNIHGVSFK